MLGECGLGDKDTFDALDAFLDQNFGHGGHAVVAPCLRPREPFLKCDVDDQGQWHSKDGSPLIDANGDSFWFFHGAFASGDFPHAYRPATDTFQWLDADFRLHREGVDASGYPLPAVVDNQAYGQGKNYGYCHGVKTFIFNPVDGSREFFDADGRRHRSDGQVACVDGTGSKFWVVHGVPCRPDGLPHCETAGGDKHWLDAAYRLHREGGGPALINAAGDKYWYNHGILCSWSVVGGPPFHGGDCKEMTETEKGQGPMAVMRNGANCWLFQGEDKLFVLHRDKGPAFVDALGTKRWFRYGKCFRAGSDGTSDDFPTVELASGDKMWLDSDGRRHREHGLPAVVSAEGNKGWWTHGVPRGLENKYGDDPDLPSLVSSQGRLVWINRQGKRHRSGGKPAMILKDDTKFWLVDGVFGGREHPDLPHVEFANGTVEWRDGDGRRHRDGDKPAVVFEGGSRLVWFVHGVMRRSDPDLPNVLHGDGSMEWRNEKGELHREGGKPAIVTKNFQAWFMDGRRCGAPESGCHVLRANGNQEWFDEQGRHHRPGGEPAIIEACGTRRWLEHGKPARPEGLPHVEAADGSKMWLDGNMQPHRECDDLPALQAPVGDFWYVHGKLSRAGHRPAKVYRDGVQEWWVDGVHQAPWRPVVVHVKARVVPISAVCDSCKVMVNGSQTEAVSSVVSPTAPPILTPVCNSGHQLCGACVERLTLGKVHPSCPVCHEDLLSVVFQYEV
jgi:hypothetical protein